MLDKSTQLFCNCFFPAHFFGFGCRRSEKNQFERPGFRSFAVDIFCVLSLIFVVLPFRVFRLTSKYFSCVPFSHCLNSIPRLTSFWLRAPTDCLWEKTFTFDAAILFWCANKRRKCERDSSGARHTRKALTKHNWRTNSFFANEQKTKKRHFATASVRVARSTKQWAGLDSAEKIAITRAAAPRANCDCDFNFLCVFRSLPTFQSRNHMQTNCTLRLLLNYMDICA